jgi:hypothetical protein
VKVKGAVQQTQVVEGIISASDLLALVRETFSIPERAHARFFATDNSYGGQLMLASQQHAIPPLIDVTDSSPLKFRITWEVPVAKNEQG